MCSWRITGKADAKNPHGEQQTALNGMPKRNRLQVLENQPAFPMQPNENHFGKSKHEAATLLHVRAAFQIGENHSISVPKAN